MPTTPMSSLTDSNSRVWYAYSQRDSYVVPYSSDRAGGELITEYNQRIALNTLCSRRADLSDYAKTARDRINSRYGVSTVIDQTTGETAYVSAGLNSFINYQEYANPSNWRFPATATGTQSDTDFELTVLGNGSIQISKGSAIINGYCVESTIPIELAASDVLSIADVDAAATNPEQVASNPIVSKFIKLGVMYVDSTGNTHDERLNPPVDGIYNGVAIIVDDALPDVSQLLLGTVTRNKTGTFLVVNNTAKTRILPIDAVSGAENYDTLLGAGDAEAGHIYGIGVIPGASGYLRDITDTLWLSKNSTIAKLIRGLAAQPDGATVDPKKTTRGIITTVGLNQGEGDVTQALKIDNGPSNDYPSIFYQQAYATDEDASAKIEARDTHFPFANSKSTLSGSNIIEKVLCEPIPISGTVRHYDYHDVRFPELDFEKGGTSGFITSQQAYMIEKTYAYMCNPDSQHRQYGPFRSVSEAADWFREHHTIRYELGDYFWVINDDLKMVTAGTTVAADDPTLKAVETSFGNIAGTLTGAMSGTVTGEVSGTTDSGPTIAVRGTVTGNVSGTAAGSVTGTFASITQYVSARYSCIYSGETTSTTGASRIVRYAKQNPTGEPTDKYSEDTESRGGVVDGDSTKAWFALQSVERGFGIPASAEMYGLVKCPADTETSDPMAVVKSTSDGNLKITKSLYTTIQNNGYQLNTEEAPTFYISAPRDLSEFSKTYFTGTATFVLNGDASLWEQAVDGFKTLSDIKGHVVLDYRRVTVNKNNDQQYFGGSIFTLRNVDYVTLLGDTTPTTSDLASRTSTTELRLTVDHCVVDTPFFTNIGHWHSSQFVSGSNTLELSNPWMRVDKVFTLNDNISNQLEARFASITMGEKGVTSAEMDIRIRYEANVNNSNSVDNCWASLNRIKFPPMMFQFENITPETMDNSTVSTGSVDLHTIQYIPDGLILKIGATAGVHEVLNVANSEQYVVSGNLLAVVDWGYNTHNEIGSTPEEKLYFNLYMKNSSGDARQRISNFSVRVPVQILNGTNNLQNQYAPYEALYQTTLGN